MATPKLPAVILGREKKVGQNVQLEKTAPMTFAEYVVLKEYQGTATITLDQYLNTLQTKVQTIQNRFGNVSSIRYGTELPKTAKEGDIFFKIKSN